LKSYNNIKQRQKRVLYEKQKTVYKRSSQLWHKVDHYWDSGWLHLLT